MADDDVGPDKHDHSCVGEEDVTIASGLKIGPERIIPLSGHDRKRQEG